jgi:ubiquinone/menaquinone biosynthesis C-methylase UbiE
MNLMTEYVVSQFGNPRGWFGMLVGHAMALKNRERIAWAVSELDVRASDRVLEIGFGPGVALKRIASLAIDGHAAGVELSSLMLSQASRRLASEIAAGRVELQHGSVSSLDFDDGSFDKVLAINTMMFWPDPANDLLEVARVLKPGGQLLVVQQPHGARDEDAVRRIGQRIRDTMEAAGFAGIGVRTRRMWPVTCLCVSGVKPRRDGAARREA